MTYFFLGFLLIILDLPLELSGHTINFLPDFVGYWLLYKGCQAHYAHSSRFEKAAIASIVGIAVGGIAFVLDLLGWGSVLSAARLAVYYWASKQTICGILELERCLRFDLNGEKLRDLWGIGIGTEIAAAVLIVAGQEADLLLVIGLALLLVSIVVKICFMVTLWGSKKRYGKFAESSTEV